MSDHSDLPEVGHLVDEDDDPTSLEMLADYECPDCGPVEDMDLSEDEALAVFGGDEKGALICPIDWCDEELELTAEAAAANLAWLAERLSGAFVDESKNATRASVFTVGNKTFIVGPRSSFDERRTDGP